MNTTSHSKGNLSRREMLCASASSLLALGLWPGVLRAEGESRGEDFSFIAVNDTHYVDEKCGAWLQTAIARMKECSPKPELCLMSGDYAEHGTVAELAAARDVFKSLGFPTYGVIGNHDWLKNDDRKPYEEVFPNQINHRFDHCGWQFMALDTTEGLKAGRTKIADATLQWVDDNLSKFDKKSPLILVSHFQLGPGINNRPLNTDALLERFKDYNLRAVFCGHFHGFTESKLGEAVFTTDKCCSLKARNHDRTTEKGFFFCQIKNGVIQRTFVEVPVPATT
jgi:3',5'-cyclic AMP phosphodiesterase CpdA